MKEKYIVTEFQNEVANKLFAELTNWLLATKVEKQNMPHVEGAIFIPTANTKLKFKITFEGKQQIKPTK